MRLHSTYWEREIKKQTYVSGGNSAEKNRAGQGERLMESTDDIHTQGLFLWAGTQKIQQL